jgi:hypothetical protein
VTNRFVAPALAAGALFFLVTGAWAFLAPRSFFDSIATYPPYNEHLFHDLGAYGVGIGVALLIALAGRTGLITASVGAAVASVLHAVAHWMDRDLGGRRSDPWFITGLAVVLVIAAVLAVRVSASPSETEGTGRHR